MTPSCSFTCLLSPGPGLEREMDKMTSMGLRLDAGSRRWVIPSFLSQVPKGPTGPRPLVRAMTEGGDTKVEPVLWVTCWLGWAWGQNRELGLTFQGIEGLGSWLVPGLLQCQLGSTLLGLRDNGEMR